MSTAHQFRYFASHESIVLEGGVTIGLCELCGGVFIITTSGPQHAPMQFDDGSDVSHSSVIELFMQGKWDELDKPLHEGGKVIRQYRSLI